MKLVLPIDPRALAKWLLAEAGLNMPCRMTVEYDDGSAGYPVFELYPELLQFTLIEDPVDPRMEEAE